MRLPGFFHLKHAPYLTTIIYESGQQPFKRENFLRALRLEALLKSRGLMPITFLMILC